MTVSECGEEELLKTLTSPLSSPVEGAEVGIGDDCAVLPGGTLLKTDCIVEGVHFLPSDAPKLVGRKAVARVLSDFAAMGGYPSSLLLTLGLHPSTAVSYLRAFYEGVAEICSAHSCSLVGGETTSILKGGTNFYSVAGTGQLHGNEPVLRSGGKRGDALYVTGKLGGSFVSGRHLSFEPRLREAQWLAEHVAPHAMMDLSDGLGSDLPRLARASGLGYELDHDSLPRHEGCSIENALGDGEDYELLFALPPHRAVVLGSAPFECTKIGSLTSVGPSEQGQRGWEHFR